MPFGYRTPTEGKENPVEAANAMGALQLIRNPSDTDFAAAFGFWCKQHTEEFPSSTQPNDMIMRPVTEA